MKILGVIPARYASSRFPGKPLADLNGKPMVWHVYMRAKKAIDNVIIATDSDLIYDKLSELGAKVIMTSDKHRSGTERVAEAAAIYQQTSDLPIDWVINIQGDEPLIQPQIIRALINIFDCKVSIATLIKHETDQENLFNSNVVKVVVNHNSEAIYFSRSPIPYLRDFPEQQWIEQHRFFTHIGIYAYRYQVLQEIIKLPPSTLEEAEKLEQLRWIDNGYRIKTVVVDYTSIGVDTPEDLEKVRTFLLQQSEI